MFIQVRLLKGFQELLWYKIPVEWPTKDLLGSLVTVPFRKSFIPALVESLSDSSPLVDFVIKEATSYELLTFDKHYKKFINQLACYYQIPQIHLIKRLSQFLFQKEQETIAHQAVDSTSPISNPVLTEEQDAVVNFISPALLNNTHQSVLLHGITGSGKTEVYKALITQAIAHQKSVIILLPDVSLSVHFTLLLRQQLSSINIYGFHSATSVKEKKMLWHDIIHSKPVVIIGVHLPILLPIGNIGLIIVDEEHDVGFQEKKYPKINSKEAAIRRARCYNIPILLGSATPSISSLYQVKQGNWYFFQLKKRFAGQLPTIKQVSLNDKKKRRNFWISKELDEAIADRLAKGEQTILFLNRRGFSFFVQCKECNFIVNCNNCSVSLTLHDDNCLRCHYCGFMVNKPTSCTQCKVDGTHFINKGIGTQQLTGILQKLFPHARIARADLDTTINKKAWQKTLDDFQQGSLDILIGTQTVTKGYHFPRVTLVGIIWADLNLHFPLFNASETTLQQLIQVAGRAGRFLTESTVIVQTMMQHTIFDYLNETDYLKFYKHEIESRAEVLYPPCTNFVEIELKHHDETIVETETAALITILNRQNDTLKTTVIILGPAKPLVHKIKNTFSRKIYLKGDSLNNIINLFHQSINRHYKSAISFTPNPVA